MRPHVTLNRVHPPLIYSLTPDPRASRALVGVAPPDYVPTAGHFKVCVGSFYQELRHAGQSTKFNAVSKIITVSVCDRNSKGYGKKKNIPLSLYRPVAKHKIVK